MRADRSKSLWILLGLAAGITTPVSAGMGTTSLPEHFCEACSLVGGGVTGLPLSMSGNQANVQTLNLGMDLAGYYDQRRWTPSAVVVAPQYPSLPPGIEVRPATNLSGAFPYAFRPEPSSFDTTFR